MKFAAANTGLEERLKRWHEQLERLKAIEGKFLTLKASKESFYSDLFLKAEGKSIAEREAIVYGSEAWKQFADGLAASQTEYNHELRSLELKQKAYEAEYLITKLDAEAIKRSA